LRQTPKHELLAARLREGMTEGRWHGSMPGVRRLAEESKVSHHTVRRALLQLEAEGLLGTREAGRRRGITPTGHAAAVRRPLRVGILRHDVHLTDDLQSNLYLIEAIHHLEEAGHIVISFKKSQIELKHDVLRMARQLAEIPVDAWLIDAGSRGLLEWCSTQQTPCLAVCGRTGGLPLARTGPDKVPAYRAATRQLLALGHRRIVLIVREARRKPTPGISERAFLDELAAHGIPTGDYNLPQWEETPAGFAKLLDGYFRTRTTPPTALIIDETPRYFAAAEFLARHRIHVPEQVSLVSTDCDSAITWCQPGIAHIKWDYAPMVRRMVRWVAAVAKGKADRKVINIPAEFVAGGSIGPVWNG
jgi:DNA-binding LacI/PurR family transcriptional regulator